ncbi:DUF4189 domain-containing protein [Paracidovorax avenae]|uniref:DUF4189 domain-containing protein n=1 Tax=Paracidovorax avenae TaxID=80867 RepID=UPI000D222525|nr:DUF4189 domain-containing protein [Paracidovorax avenae]AVT12549.1 hypothetical protein C8235_06400 [Paracidovorax avenae]
MKSQFTCSLLLAASLLAPSLFAQTACPSGVAAGSALCGPSGDSGDSAPSRPTGYWVKTWGALVSSNKAKEAWSSKGKDSEADARKDALGRCQARGFSDCSLDTTYFNQCVAVVSSDEQKGITIGKSGSKEAAESVGLKSCKERGNQHCTIEFSDCTVPYFVKY